MHERHFSSRVREIKRICRKMEHFSNDKEQAHLEIAECDCKDDGTDLSTINIVCKKAGNVLVQSAYFELDNLASLIDMKPYQSLTSLLIYENSFRRQLKPADLLKDMNTKLPQSRTNIVLLVSEYRTTEDAKLSDRKDQEKVEPSNKKNILVYFFATVGLRNRIYEATLSNANHFGFCKNLDEEGDRFVEELGLNNCEYVKSTLLLFGNVNSHFLLSRILNKLRNSIPNGHEMNWMYAFGEALELSSSSSISANRASRRHQLVALRITGPSIESWSASFSRSTERGDFEHKLAELRKRVRLKRHCLGLLFSPKCVFDECDHSRQPSGLLFTIPTEAVSGCKCDHSEHPCGVSRNVMQHVAAVFPGVPFVGLFYYSLMFGRRSAPELGDINSIFTGECGYYAHQFGMIMILTYD